MEWAARLRHRATQGAPSLFDAALTVVVTVVMIGAYAAAGYVPGAALCAVYVALFTVATLEPRQIAIGAGVISIAVLFIATGAGGPFGWVGGTNTVMLAFSVAS